MALLSIEVIAAKSRDGDKFAVKVRRQILLRSKHAWWGPEFDGRVGEAINYGFYDKNGFAQIESSSSRAPEWFTCKNDAEKLAELIQLVDWPPLQEPCGRGNTI